MSMNPSITPEFVEENIYKEWNWYLVSRNPSITPNFIEKYHQCKWNWSGLSINPSITPEFVEKHHKEEWCWFRLSINPSTTPEFIEKHPRKDWSYYRFFSPERAKSERDKIIMDNLKIHLCAYRIQFWWRNILENPHVKFSYEFTKKKLFDEFEVDHDRYLTKLN